MHPDKGLLKIGLEIEVCGWENGRTYQDVAKDLVEHEPQGYMQGPIEQWQEYHQYHCSCDSGGCRQVRRGDLIVPPLVSMTYDASLPKTGAEFIVSPILLADGSSGMNMLKEIWDIVVKDSLWLDEGINYHGGDSVSPSIHIHVSANMAHKADYGVANMSNTFAQDIMHAVELFSPELFALAESGQSNRRGLQYRLPNRMSIYNDDMGSHHGFIQVRAAVPTQLVYIEWRLFEAAYTDWEYVEARAYLASVLTRALLDRNNLGTLMSKGYDKPYDETQLYRVSRQDDLPGLLELVNMDRLSSLRELCLGQIDDDQYGFLIIDNMFEKVMGEL